MLNLTNVISKITDTTDDPCAKVGAFLYAGTKTLQVLAQEHVINYQPFMGYTADIGFPMFVTPYLLAFAKDAGDRTRAGITLAVPVVLTAFEFLGQYSESKIPVFDPLDIPCYFGGALLTYALTKKPADQKNQQIKVASHMDWD